MIAGETQRILSRNARLDYYDNFLFFGKNKNKKPKAPKKVKKELSPEEQAAKRARRQQFWSNLGSSLKEGGTVSNVLELFKGNAGQSTQEDYQINIGDQENLPPSPAGSSKEDTKEKSIPIPALVIGGVLLLSVVYLTYQNYQSSQESKRLQS